MMKNIFALVVGILFILTISLTSTRAQEAPKVSKTEFPDSALLQTLIKLDGQIETAGNILDQYKGQTVMLYIWATWCPDCIKGFPELFEFQKANPDIRVVYFSLDREEQRWREGIEKYELKGDHFWFKTAWKNPFTNAIDLNWIPRYLVIGQDGKIAKYYAVKADDPGLQIAVDTTRP